MRFCVFILIWTWKSIWIIISFINNQSNKLIIHEIFVKEEFRNKGLCKEFIKYLIDKFPHKKIIIQSVLSKILYNFLLRFEYKNRYFMLKKEGFYLIWKIIL